MIRKITIAIDGYSSTGKSTVAKQLADYLYYVYVDTGAMYRAITLFALKNNIINKEFFNKELLVEKLPEIEIGFVNNTIQGRSDIHLNGINVEKEIRTLTVSNFVSAVSTVSEVRKKLVAIQHKMGKEKGIVMDGRDIGTVVFPDAELKIFMTADADKRAMRRYKELIARGDKISYKDILHNVQTRDHIDTTRKDSPLIKAKDAIVIDNSEINLEDQFHIVLQLAKDRIAGRV